MIPGWRESELPEPQLRDGAELTGMTADPSCRITGPIYQMFRDIARSEEDRRWLEGQRVRYDITRIPPATYCNEFVKTKGHYHPLNPAGVAYPEVYEVMAGHAHYLLQRPDHSDAVLIDAPAGSIVLIAPGYGHVTINPGEEDLVMSNLVSTAFSSDYRPYEVLHGAVYYELADGTFVPNPAYPRVPPLRRLRPPDLGMLGLPVSGTLYGLVEERVPLDWLNEPERFAGLLSLRSAE
ncbi:MAG TPA: glucose-6-phosphate isomerase family protein [Methanoregulaceae archaeon]|nr:glucose-6-phosphate isomerase family protein [Methanoregulaceae archaeon]